MPPPRGPEGPPGGALGPPGALGPEALRAGGLGKHGLAITRSVLERHGLSTGRGLAVLGEAFRGLRRGKADVQTSRTFESRTVQRMDLEGQEDLVEPFSTPSPVGRRIEAPLGGVPPPNVFGARRVVM